MKKFLLCLLVSTSTLAVPTNSVHEIQTYWGGSQGQQIVTEYLATFANKNMNHDDWEQEVEKFLAKIVGPDIAKFIVETANIPEIKDRLEKLYADTLNIGDPQKYPDAVKEIGKDIAWVATYGAVVYYTRIPILLPGTAAWIAETATGLMISLTKLNVSFCGLIHG